MRVGKEVTSIAAALIKKLARIRGGTYGLVIGDAPGVPINEYAGAEEFEKNIGDWATGDFHKSASAILNSV